MANAGADQKVEVGAIVILDGSGSSDDDGDALNYQWIPPDNLPLDDLEISTWVLKKK